MFLLDDFLTRAKEGAGIKSDFKLARALGITQASVSTWRIGKSLPSDAIVIKLCAFSGDDPLIVCVQLAAVRAPDEASRKLWEMVEFRLKKARHFDVQGVIAAIELEAA